eukprot:Skav203581  [mRNA]  locus=scaffold935:89412:94199:+ [translate_table: standard]
MTGPGVSEEDHSRSTLPIRIPGARASTFTGEATLRSCLEHLLEGRCRLGCFARSFAAQQFTRSKKGDSCVTELFPMGLPYPEVLAKKNRCKDNAFSLKRGVSALVLVLNYLYLGRPKKADVTLHMRRKLSKKQWEVVRRFELMMEAWDDSTPITPETMGRTAGKVEDLEDVLAELEAMSRTLTGAQTSYFGEQKQVDRPGAELGTSLEVVGKMERSLASPFKPVDASRLSFVGRPNFDPSPYLDPVSKAIFNDPLKTRMPPEECRVKPPKLRVHCSRSEKVKLFELLDASDRLHLHLGDQVTPLFGSGLFSVPKDLERDRMILDSRGANLLEIPPQRWIQSLGAAEALCKLCLEPQELLLASGNDLRDFYYLFRATPSRSRRNVLVGALHPKEVAHLRCFQPEHAQASVVYGSLGSLAMGDCQAVEMAQSCHLGMALQWNVATADNLLSLNKPIPRSPTMTGLVIDDFVALTRATLNEAEEGRPLPLSEGALLSDQMQKGYEEVKLIPNTKKAFRDEEQSSFWGIDLDGRRGLLRGSLKRAIPLCNIMLRVVRLGYSSADLMQIIGGSLVSLFLFRRRFLSLLDGIFSSYRNCTGREVFKLDGRLRSDLLCLAVLIPMAVTNLKAAPPTVVGASDASNWGEAGVTASIPRQIGKELIRHSLRKSVWNRLLTPHKAWLRGHDMLDPGDELPPGVEQYVSNPLWELVATALQYKLLYSKSKSGPRHINIGELRAALKTERLLGGLQPSSRVLLGADSQVALGALIKGRSSSSAMNSELVKSIPHMLALDTYLELMYFHTSLNRADQPTRGKEIEGPTKELPDWWYAMLEGNFEPFDRWRHALGLDDHSLSGLPDFQELCGEVSPPGILPTFLQKGSEQAAGHSGSETAKATPGSLPSSSTSAQALSGTVKGGRDLGVASLPPQSDPYGSAVASSTVGVAESSSSSTSAQLPKQTVVHGRSKAPADQPCDPSMPPLLSEAAKELLCRFGRGQVVMRSGESWPPERAGFLDLFSGEKGVAKALQKHCNVWSLCFELEDGADQDLSQPTLRSLLEQMLREGCFIGVGGGPVCRTFFMAVRPPVRSKTEPYGKAAVSPKMREKILEGNDMAFWCIKVLDLALTLKIAVWLENPGSSWLFRLPEWKELETRWPSLRAWTVDYCRFGTPWRKRTKFFSDTVLSQFRTLCAGCKKHQLLQGRSKEHGKSWTLVAQPYPAGVCEALALGLLQRSKLVELKQNFDPAECAKAGHGRVGEAAHPGPRPFKDRNRTGLLEEVPLVEAKTKALQDKIWGSFLGWLNSTLTPGAVHSAMSHPCLLVLLAREYGNHLYSTGRSLYVFRHLLVFLQQNFLTIRPLMGACWSMVTRWELMEPTEHRVPLPYAVFCAMVSVAIGWGWHRFAGILSLGFLGIARPGEPLRATRGELVLPRDTLSDCAQVAYLKILKPKTRQRGRGKIQHISIHDARFITFLDKVFGLDEAHVRLLDCTPSAFRRRWDAVLHALAVPKASGLTPGGVRGGGCVHAFQTGVDISMLLWRMRIKHMQTLESYLQEVVASTVVAELPLEARRKISAAASMTFFFMQQTPMCHTFSMLDTRACVGSVAPA